VGTLVALGLVCISNSKGQTAAPGRPSATINWTGCLVVGQRDPIDQIARGAYPTTVQQVEIGLRSDGVVVWRKAAAK
jgi:hypothetical protein